MANQGPLLGRVFDRVRLDREDGDIAYFHALSLTLEYLTKVITAGVVACIGEDTSRHRYSLEHKLVRSNGIGDWVEVLNAALTGPAAQLFEPSARDIVRELSERVGAADWRHAVVAELYAAARDLGVSGEIGQKVSLRQFFSVVANIRNRTRGHGATTAAQCSRACPPLLRVAEALAANGVIFKQPWAYLHRNFSGKYRVVPLNGSGEQFEYLKRSRDVSLTDGTYLFLQRPIAVPMVYCDADVRDVFLPNGNFRDDQFETLSYITNETRREQATRWIDPPDRLPPSETEGRPVLDQVGNVFANLPPRLTGYVRRSALEAQLTEELVRIERHPILSLTGPGGIGKTTLAVAAIEEIAKLSNPPYSVVVWISARDIDLLESGPKPVAPRVVTQKDIALAAIELLSPHERALPGFRPQQYLENCLRNGAAGPTLFVLDNFETVESPSDVFRWLDTHIRLPNKVLITTRFREFAGDYPIEIGGMTEDEAHDLISREAQRLGIEPLITGTYRDELIRESDGHPYVIKILLGQVAKERRAVTPERIVASSDLLLRALFERTFARLTPAAQRVFLLLCSWRVLVPELAVEAVELRPGNERFDVSGALSELRRFSLVEEVASDADGERFVGVPLAAAIYGRRKLEVSPYKAAIEEDRRLLMEFGAGKREDVSRGVFPRIEGLIKAVASRVGGDGEAMAQALPVLEYLASRVPRVYLRLVDLVMESEELPDREVRAKGYLRSILEVAEPQERQRIWIRLADLCYSASEFVEEIHALTEAALLPTANIDDLEALANRINNRVRELKLRSPDTGAIGEVKLHLANIIRAMEKRLAFLSATGCSRLAWLHLNVGNEDRAREVMHLGLQRDPRNEHCQNLLRKLGAS